jgi:hypothetical protein
LIDFTGVKAITIPEGSVRKITNAAGTVLWEKPTADIDVLPVFADNTWEQIIAACHNNAVPSTWVVGNQKSMTINGADYAIDIIGKNHDAYSDGSGKAPLTLQLNKCYATRYSMNGASNTNAGGWTNCDMRITHLPAIKALLPASVQAGINKVNKLTSAGSQSTVINTTQDDLFCLSEVEIFGATGNSVAGEGTQYEYYAAGGSTVKKRGNSSSSWWERSPNAASSNRFCRVNGDGTPGREYSKDTYGVSFAFCF